MRKIILAHDAETDNRGLDVTECRNPIWENELVIEVDISFALHLVRNALENAGVRNWKWDHTLTEIETRLMKGE